ncbi:MAG: hypothetical protein JXA21_12725 [Anaerolineae bacterium]|nr:hypothetical protein [Anaerolineae bacterium]
MEEIASLRRQLAKLNGHLLTVEEQEADYIDPRNIPPDLAENGKLVRVRISECQERLLELQVGLPQNNTVEIPIVIVAMNKQQASELIQNGLMDAYADFQNLLIQFPEDEIHQWLGRYGDDREDWHPHTCAEFSIREIVDEIITESSNSRPDSPMLSSQFCTTEFFSDSADVQERIWCQMSENGGVVIIDAVSLFHPDIRQTLADSELMSNDNMAIVVMSPIDPMMHQANQVLEVELRKRMKRAFARFHLRHDKMCEIGIGNLRSLKRWFATILPEATASIQGLRPSQATLERTWETQREEPQGINRYFSGQGGT